MLITDASNQAFAHLPGELGSGTCSDDTQFKNISHRLRRPTLISQDRTYSGHLPQVPIPSY